MRVLIATGLLVLISARSGRAETGVASETPPPSNAKTEAQVQENRRFGRGKLMTGKGTKGYIAFTFDDGPNMQTTPKVLASLESFGVPATFFVVGRHFRGKKPENLRGAQLIESISARGFAIANHTTHHKNLSKLGYVAGVRQVAENAAALKEILGYEPRLFRPPFGATSPAIRRYLHKRGDTMVRWNIDPADFRSTKDSKGLRKRVVRQILAKQGGILLLHDTKSATANALPGILQDLENANCQRLSQGERPIIPVSLDYFYRRSGRKSVPMPLSERKSVHEFRHRLQKHCNRMDHSN